MNRLGLAVLGALIGLVVGIVIGNVFFTDKSPKPVLPDVQHYYYRLSDSTMARHTISVTDSGLDHRIDTIDVEQR